MKTLKNNWVALVAVVIAILGLFFGGSTTTVVKPGAITTNLPSFGLASLAVGSACGDAFTTCNGTELTGLVAGSCNLIGTNASQAASSTKAYDCAVTNMTSSYKVMAILASSTAPVTAGIGPWSIDAAKASTTAGYVTVLLHNYGASAVPSATGVGSSTVIWGFK